MSLTLEQVASRRNRLSIFALLIEGLINKKSRGKQ